MSRFNRDSTSVIQKEIRDKVEHPRIGRVLEVYTHESGTDDSNFEVDIDMTGNDKRDEQYVPVISPGGNQTIDIPKKGDKVLVVYTEESGSKPFVMGTTFTQKDRPPLGRAGMWRREFESRSVFEGSKSPLGAGDIYLTGYTEYDDNPENNEKYKLNPKETFFQISKHLEGGNINPADKNEVPAKIEFYDSPANEEAWISVEINKEWENGAPKDSNSTWGFKFNVGTGEFKIVDPEGYGIHAKGNGVFEWHHEDITFNEVGAPGDGGGPLDL